MAQRSQLKSDKQYQQIPGLSQLQFVGLVTVIATGITLIGIAVILLTNRRLAAPFITAPTEQKQKSLALTYNVRKPPNIRYSQDLQVIVDEIVNRAAIKGLPTEPLSVSLIDLKSQTFAGYQNQTLRFPASISKLFWMVALYAQIEKGILPSEAASHTPLCKTDICKLIQKSDNEAASRILDELTLTTSGSNLEGKEYETWLSKRKQVNIFFQAAGYEGINISQKNFPIPYLKLDKPQGRELQMRGDSERPIRNKMTTDHAARLMYEIFTGQAVSPIASEEMMRLLTRDLRPEVWKQEQYNSVEGFLGESLPLDRIYFASKVGWTFSSRQEVAYIASIDGKAAYILVIFADDRAYGDDWKIFPELSLHVFNRMTGGR